MSEMDEMQKMPEKKHPKKLQKTLDRLRVEGDEALFAFSAVPRRYQSEQSVAMARIGVLDEKRINTWLVVTQDNLIFIRGGLLRNKVDKFPMGNIDDVEYVKEFQDNTIKIKIKDAAENVRFYDELDGIQFYKYIKEYIKGRRGE